MQAEEGDGIDAVADELGGLLVEVGRRLSWKMLVASTASRAVDVDGEVVVPMDEPARLDVAQEIEHLLRAPDGEGGDDDVASPVEGALDDLGEAFGIVGGGLWSRSP